MHPKQEATQSSLYRLLCLMKNPDPRNDNSAPLEYRGDFRAIGACYLGFVVSLTAPLKKDVFQRRLRIFFRDRARELYRRTATGQDLQQRYDYQKTNPAPHQLPGDLEEKVFTLAKRGNYEDIGRAVKRGAHLYHQHHAKDHQRKLSEEYDHITKALQKII